MNLSCCLYLKEEKSSLYFALFHQLCFLFIGILTQKFCRKYAQRSTKEIMTSPKTVIKSQSLLKDKCKFCFYHIAGKKVPEIIFKSQRLTRLIIRAKNFTLISISFYCQAQGPTQGRVKIKVKVGSNSRSRSGHGQGMVKSGLLV